MERGFLLLAWGEKYLFEAVNASKHLRKHNAEPICLITGQNTDPWIASHFDILIEQKLRGDYSDKILIKQSPFRLTIFLDTDIMCCRSLSGLFDTLVCFDIAVTFTEGGHHYSLPGIPSLFHEPSAGLIAWKKSGATHEFFVLWEEWYNAIQDQIPYWGAWDQRSLRAAIFFSNVRVCPIPDRYQFYTYRPNIVEGEVAAIHGRNISAALLKQINQTKDLRIWIPRIGFCRAPSRASFLELVAFSIRILVRAIQLLIRRILAFSGVYKYPAERRPM